MINRIRENGFLFSIAVVVAGAISTVAVTRYQISGLIAEQPEVQRHIHDTTRHIDPLRDIEARRQLIERIEKLEEHLERSERRREWAGERLRQRDDRR